MKQYLRRAYLVGSFFFLVCSQLVFADPLLDTSTPTASPPKEETPTTTTPSTSPITENQDLSPKQQEIQDIIEKAAHSATRGPAEIKLLDQGTLDLPEGYLFIPASEATEVMRIMGNKMGPELVGIIISREQGLSWFITVQYSKLGYISDDDASNLNADELLNTIRKITEKSNEDRITKGFPPLSIERWIKAPAYNAASHQLAWSVLANSGKPDSVINYNALALGREGAFAFILVSPSSKIETVKNNEETIMAAIHYNEGKRYEDFIKGTDQVAAYGLAALITGVVAKKLGLIALAGVFLAKIWKMLAVAAVLFASKFKKLFKKDDSSPRKLK